MDESDWERLTDQLREGDCTPFLGAGACYGTLPTGAQLSQEWAGSHGYPFVDDGDLARVMQFAVITAKEAMWVKQRVCRDLMARGAPDFTDPSEIHAFLASFPIVAYITTNYDDFLVKALLENEKTPNRAICPWYSDAMYDRELLERGAGLDPSSIAPLVYHLHGSFQKPESLVLTEEDYLEFLVNMTVAQAANDRRLIPPAILTALTTRPLLFIGYSLQDWTFRVLFHGLNKGIPNIRRRRHISVQLTPPEDGLKPGATERATEYLERYFEGWKISIFWGTVRQFCAELRQRMETVP